jgi:hypothetical protein
MESWRKPNVVVSISTRTGAVVEVPEVGAVGVDVDPEQAANAAARTSRHAWNTTRTIQVYALNRRRVPLHV